MVKVVIIGAGLMGTATSYPLSDNGHSVHLVGTHLDGEIIKSCKEKHFHPRLKRTLPQGVRPYFIEEIAEAIEGADVILSGVNSLGVHWIGRTIKPFVKPGQMIIAITKGLEADAQGNLSILPDVLASELDEAIRPQLKFAAVGGPCIAGELAGRRQSCVVFGSRDFSAAEKLADIFRTSYYHIWKTDDLVGLEFGAAFKNAYTLAVGMAYGFLETVGGVDEAGANDHNLAAAVFAQSCVEMKRLLEISGSDPSFAYKLPGSGDLYVTAVGGRTVRLGKLLGAGKSYKEARQIMAGETLESAEIIGMMGKALPKLEKDGKIKSDELPLLRALVNVIVYGKPLEFPIDQFFGGTGIL
ncbi:MAG: hypothetical protein JW908_08135 [Anaerolineales bacterium]|nr:hypothetical protein [Anaerolineales bacterium]